MRKLHKWTEEEDAIIRSNYRGNKASKIEIAKRLGVTWQAVNGRIQFLGIAKRSDRKNWDPKQDARMMELMGRYSPFTVARILHRSVNSVVVRFKRLGGSRLARDGWYTKSDVCKILGVEHKWVQRRIDSGELSASYHYGTKPTKIGYSAWHIEEKALREYILTHQHELEGRNIDIPIFIDIILNGKKGGNNGNPESKT